MHINTIFKFTVFPHGLLRKRKSTRGWKCTAYLVASWSGSASFSKFKNLHELVLATYETLA